MKTLQERFDEKYIPEPNSGCWLWIGCTNGDYGQLWNGVRMDYAHRISYKYRYGEIPYGMQVLHKCDTPNCVNHDHLFLGTQADNMADMMAKDRGRNGKANLSFDDIIKIKQLLKDGKLKQIEIAAKYSVHKSTINHIKSGIRHHKQNIT